MAGYSSGEQPDAQDVIKLNTNENPYPAAPGVAEALAGFDVSSLRRYPPATALDFRNIIANTHGTVAEQIIATRGGDELLRLVITTFVEPGQPITITDPTYSLYPVLSQIHDCPNLIVPLLDDWSLPADFASKANAAQSPLTFLVNPGAPHGKLLPVSTVLEVAEELNGLLLVDEAYVDFVDPDKGYDLLPHINDYPNLILLRTLSKGYSLAGLRLGYGIAQQDLITPMLNKTRDSYNLDAITQKLGVAAIEHRDYAAETWIKVRAERKRLALELTARNFELIPSQTNFLLVTPPADLAAADLYQALKQNGILVRYFDLPRLTNKLRISIGTPDENNQLLRQLDKQLPK